MASTSFSESFKYGTRLFGLFLLIVIFGGGGLGLGGVLAIPEVEAWFDTGSAETAEIAGGLVLSVLGFSILVIGQFALLYKLIADGVSKGTADSAVDIAAGPEGTAESEETSDAQADQQPTPPQQSPAAAEADDPQPPDEPEQPEPQQAEPEQPSSPEPAQATDQPTETAEQPADDPPDPPAQQPTAQDQPADQQPPETQQAESPQQGRKEKKESGDQSGREQTAEEIVFGSSENDEPAESTDDFEFDEETEAENREDIETAGNPSSDPLADNFDDE